MTAIIQAIFPAFIGYREKELRVIDKTADLNGRAFSH